MTAGLDPDRTLALSYVPAGPRPALRALWQLDAALGAVLASGREPMIRQIKLAWWREALERLDHAPAPAEPVLAALSANVLPSGVSGGEIAGLEDGWRTLLTPDPLGPADLAAYASNRGARLFSLSARMLAPDIPDHVAPAGEGWALIDLARRSGGADAAAALAAARLRLAPLAGRRWPRRLRPLGMLAALAWRDARRGLDAVEPQGSPARMARMLALRLTGR